jgi:hypothetical protein
VNVLAGGPNVTVSRVIGKSKEKIGKSSGGRAKGGRSRQFCESLASQRRFANVLAGVPRVADPRVIGESKEKIGECSGGRAKGGRSRQFCKSLASQRRRLANVLAGVPRVAEQDSWGKHSAPHRGRLRRPLVATALKPLLIFSARGTRLEG